MPYMGKSVDNKSSEIRRFDVTSSTSATHTLSWTAPSEQSLIVTINGVKQHEDAYSVSGTTLTLTSALVATDKLEVIGINDIGSTITPGPGSVNESQLGSDSVSTIKLQDNAITTAKMADDAVGLAELSATGTPSSSTFLRGDNAWASAAAGLTSVQTFTSSGTWTKPSGITKVMVEVQGAGGSAMQSATTENRLGGGGGGYVKKLIDVSSISTATITIGSGGAGTSSINTANAGGNSVWSDGTNTLTGSGGGAPTTGSTYNVGTGGAASGGDLNVPGQGGGATGISRNAGGNSFLGHGGTNIYTSALRSQADGILGGGGSEYYYTWPAGSTAASGGDGIVIVTEYK